MPTSFCRGLRLWVFLLAALGVSLAISGEEKPLKNDDVVALAKAGLDDDAVVSKVLQAPAAVFDVFDDSLLALEKAGVSKPVRDAMLKRVMADYELQPLDGTKGRIFKPKGWYYEWFADADKTVWTISKEDPNKGPYQTGLRIQLFPGAAARIGPDAPAIFKTQSAQTVALAALVEKKRAAQKIFRKCDPIAEGDVVRVCLETLETITLQTGKMEDFHILYSFLWSNEMDYVVVMTFGTPPAEWDMNRTNVNVTSRFVLFGEGFGTKKSP